MSLFKARGKPKRIARDDPEQAQADEDDSHAPVVRRPGAVKQKSKLRVAFDPSNEDGDSSSAVPSETETASSSVVRPVKRNAPTSLQERLKATSLRSADDESTTSSSRPSYSKSALDELRASTPSTPKDLSLTTTPDGDSDALALSIENKFGKLPSSTAQSSAIPSATEIAERKARRARLALEASALPASTTDPNSEDYIPLDAYDSDGEFKPSRMQVGTWHEPPKEKDTRLVKDEEGFMEGFEEYTESGTGAEALGEGFARSSKKSGTDKGRSRLTTDSLNVTARQTKANRAAQRDAMRAVIDAAEGGGAHSAGSDDSDASSEEESASDDEMSRQHMFHQTQTSYALPSSVSAGYLKAQRRPKQPKETTPLVKLSAALGGLRERIEAIQLEKAKLKRRVQEVGREREEVRGRLEHIQNGLEVASRELEGINGQDRGSEGAAAGSDAAREEAEAGAAAGQS